MAGISVKNISLSNYITRGGDVVRLTKIGTKIQGTFIDVDGDDESGNWNPDGTYVNCDTSHSYDLLYKQTTALRCVNAIDYDKTYYVANPLAPHYYSELQFGNHAYDLIERHVVFETVDEAIKHAYTMIGFMPSARTTIMVNGVTVYAGDTDFDNGDVMFIPSMTCDKWYEIVNYSQATQSLVAKGVAYKRPDHAAARAKAMLTSVCEVND